MSEMLYLQTERNIKITSPVVTLGDVAQLSCSDGAVLARNQVRRVAHLPDDGYGATSAPPPPSSASSRRPRSTSMSPTSASRILF